MKWLRYLPVLFLWTPAFAGNISELWFSDGDKIPQEVCHPHNIAASSSTYGINWDGHTATQLSPENMISSLEAIACVAGGTAASSVTVTMSSMTCTNGGGIANTVIATSMTVTNMVGRPITLGAAWYKRGRGISDEQFGHSEFEERQFPLDFRVPYTVAGSPPNGQVITPSLWTNRPYHDLHLIGPWVPWEFLQISSITIPAFNSQSFMIRVYVSSSLPAPNVCNGTFSLYENGILSTSAPVALTIDSVTLPAQPGLKATMVVGGSDVDFRFQGQRFPSPPLTGALLNAQQQVAKLVRANNFIPSGDAVDVAANNFPSSVFRPHVDSSQLLYTPTNGYANARSVGLGDPYYIIGTYGDNWSTLSSDFCTNVSSWAAYCSTHGIKCALYTDWDETSDAILANQVNNFSKLLFTSSTCSYSTDGTRVAFMQTGDFTTMAALSPYVTQPTTHRTFSDAYPNQAMWQVDYDSYTAGNSVVQSSGSIWYYNDGNGYGAATNEATEAEGYMPEAYFWGLWEKLCSSGTCPGGYFDWEGTYWQDVNSAQNDNDLYNVAKTFGYSAIYTSFTVTGINATPSCDYQDSNGVQYQHIINLFTGSAPNQRGLFEVLANTATSPSPPASGTLSIVSGQCAGSGCSCTGDSTISYSTYIDTAENIQWGYDGFNYSQDNGVEIWPGVEATTGYTPNFGVQAGVPGFTLERMRQGIDDIDILNAAYAVNPSSTTNLVRSMVTLALWEAQCVNNFPGGDCSYAFGDQTYAYGANSWATARQQALQIAAGQTPSPAIPNAVIISGKVQMSGPVVVTP